MRSSELFEKAHTALKSALLLLQSKDYDGACNRAYYAMFDAARGALLVTNEVKDLSVIKTHTGLISQFSLHLVKTGKVSIEHGKALNKVEDLRLIADYTDNAISEQDSAWALTQAKSFVDAMGTLVRADRTT
jgi:uncharacterized protein (UPF0332 family)